MEYINEPVLHPHATSRRGLQYEFTPKHHGAEPSQSCWLVTLTLDAEFEIFNRADGVLAAEEDALFGQVADEDGNLYGYSRSPDGGLLEIGTWHQQIAEFPRQRDGSRWHGYPVWPLSDSAPENRRGDKCRPSKLVFQRLLDLEVITKQQRKLLSKGEQG